MNDVAKNLVRCQKDLTEYEKKLAKETDQKKKVHLAMCVAGLKNTIRELKEQL